MKSQMKISKQFQRINPCFETSRFIAEQAGAHADHGQKLPGANGSRQLYFGRLRARELNQQDCPRNQKKSSDFKTISKAV